MKNFLKLLFMGAVAFTSFEFNDLQAAHDRGSWNALKEGNELYVDNRRFARQRRRTADTQTPHTIVLSCADSRVTPEFIFSQRIGDLFVVRSAGQVTDDVVIDSIEFAVRTFRPTTLVVMSHTRCGAVEGALDRLRRNGGVVDKQHGHLLAVLIPIEKAIVAAGIDIYGPHALEQSLRANVVYIVNQLLTESPVIAKAVADKRIKIVGAEYNLRSGKVKKYFTVK
jgi:carbonic anhydrase